MKFPLVWGMVVLGLFLSACGPAEQAPEQVAVPVADHPGKALFDMYCQSCHQLPDPADLDQKTWKNSILVRMGAYMGIYYDNVRYHDQVPEKWVEPGDGGQRVLAAGIYPKKPILSKQEFEELRAYVLETAPQSTSGPAEAKPIPKDLAGFEAKPFWSDTLLQPFVSALHIVPGKNRVYAGLLKQCLIQFDSKGTLQDSMSGFIMPVQIEDGAHGFRVTDLGSMGGSDNPIGKYREAKNFAQLKAGNSSFRSNFLHRPTQVHLVDLDGDGDMDKVISEFGYHLGQLSWWEKVPRGYDKHILFPDDGAVAVVAHDFNGDDRPDLAVLMANSDERLVIYENEGEGKFKENRLFRYNPTFGGAAMELADVDGDGQQDLVVSNGDNGDYPPILKPHHGVRVYRHTGGFEFEEWSYLPMNGAYGTRTRDFDEDGDMDIAAVAFYPDYKNRPEEAFIYFEQTTKGVFEPHTFPGVDQSRWMVMDAGDVDGDGDEDILLGGFNVKSDDASEATYNKWMDNNVPILMLENKLR